jgi:ATP-dependent Clp protease ATP-binding subunit ClpC
MPKINVYLPDELATAVKEASLPVSAICQTALEKAVRDAAALHGEGDSLAEAVADATAKPPGTRRRGLLRRFTVRARTAVEAAPRIAADHDHDYVGTEHVLLGILEEGDNLAVHVLVALDVDPDDVRAELEASMGPATGKAVGHARFTPLAKSALATAVQEALRMGHNYIGCEHLLLALVAEEKGLAGQVLRRLGVELRTTRMAVTSTLSGFVQGKQQPERSESVLNAILARLDAIESRLPETG